MEISDRMRRLLEAAKKLARERQAKEDTDKLIAVIKARVRAQSGKPAVVPCLGRSLPFPRRHRCIISQQSASCRLGLGLHPTEWRILRGIALNYCLRYSEPPVLRSTYNHSERALRQTS